MYINIHTCLYLFIYLSIYISINIKAVRTSWAADDPLLARLLISVDVRVVRVRLARRHQHRDALAHQLVLRAVAKHL